MFIAIFGEVTPKKKLTWQDKLCESKGYPKVEEIKGGMSRKWGTDQLLLLPLLKQIN
jgi:hypothetical protein